MPTRNRNLAQRILDKALALGEESSWEDVRLHAVADALDISLNDVRQYYPQKDDLVEAWFDRADNAVLADRASEEFLALPARDRLQRVIMAWLDALAPHRRLTREMLANKLEFGHVDLQVLGLLRIGRTVQWFREAAYEDATHIQRVFEESTLSALYLMNFARWLFDDSPETVKTRDFLQRSLTGWDNLGRLCDEFLKGELCHRWPAPTRTESASKVVATEFRHTERNTRPTS